MSPINPRADARARIVRAASELLATGGRNAVTTRAVSAAAAVQPPTIYRHFGDMLGLLDVVARETLAVHIGEQATRALTNDPVEDLRRGWDLHIAFGLAHPDAFALLYSAPSVAASVSAIHEGVAVLQGLVARIARAGRLRVEVAHATDLLHAAGTGVTLALAATPPDERDLRLSETMREAILAAITVPASAEATNRGPNAASAAQRVTVHAVALRALLAETPSILSPAEQQLLGDWLDRLAKAGNQAWSTRTVFRLILRADPQPDVSDIPPFHHELPAALAFVHYGIVAVIVVRVIGYEHTMFLRTGNHPFAVAAQWGQRATYGSARE
jgi:AcrR family transcriptional regulator